MYNRIENKIFDFEICYIIYLQMVNLKLWDDAVNRPKFQLWEKDNQSSVISVYKKFHLKLETSFNCKCTEMVYLYKY